MNEPTLSCKPGDHERAGRSTAQLRLRWRARVAVPGDGRCSAALRILNLLEQGSCA